MSGRCIGLSHVDAHWLLLSNGFHLTASQFNGSVVFNEYHKKDLVVILMIDGKYLAVRDAVGD